MIAVVYLMANELGADLNKAVDDLLVDSVLHDRNEESSQTLRREWAEEEAQERREKFVVVR